MTNFPNPCPRCGSTPTATVAHSPVPGRWTMQSCGTCWYAWRSTESITATDPDHYPQEFRVDVTSIADAPRIV
jgi:vanillate/4-hydroxybenzoate decarboxylase subunit D